MAYHQQREIPIPKYLVQKVDGIEFTFNIYRERALLAEDPYGTLTRISVEVTDALGESQRIQGMVDTSPKYSRSTEEEQTKRLVRDLIRELKQDLITEDCGFQL